MAGMGKSKSKFARPPKPRIVHQGPRITFTFIWQAGILIILIIAAYAPVWNAGYIWDDFEAVQGNVLLRSPGGVWRLWAEPSSNLGEEHYWPLTYTTFWLEYRLFGPSPRTSHVVNVLLHVLNAVILWLILRRLKIPGAWFGAAFFALHPVRAESVAWIVERKDVLSGLFYLIAFWAYWRWMDDKRDKRLYALALAAFAFSLLSKSITVTLPVAIGICLWWKKGRITSDDILPLAPFFILGLVFSLGDMAWVHHRPQGFFGLTAADRLITPSRALILYIWKWICPIKLITVYPQWEVGNEPRLQDFIYPAAIAALVAILWILRGRIGRALLASFLFFAVTLAPVLGFIDFSYMSHSYMADRFQYLASISLGMLLAGGVAWSIKRLRLPESSGLATGMAVCFLLGIGTFQRAGVFESIRTLTNDTIAKNPRAWSAHINYGNWLNAHGQIDEALSHYKQALAIVPSSAEAHNNTGAILSAKGKSEEAISYFKKAVELSPKYADAYSNLGQEYLELGRIEEAKKYLSEALRLNPDHPDALNNLGSALLISRDIEGAIGIFKHAIAVDSSKIEPYVNLAHIYTAKRNISEAIYYYRQAVRLNPQAPDLSNDLAWLLATTDDKTLRNPEEALTLALRACEITNRQNPAFLDTLAMAYASAGRYEDAIRAEEEALNIAIALEDSDLLNSIKKRLVDFISHEPEKNN
jgi:tetratricopeptide (TPR) repeat protein